MEKEKIIITGGSGFIGTNLVDHFVSLGWKVLNLDINPPRNSSHKDYWQKVDITNLEELKLVFDAFKPDYVLHFAARTDLEETDDLSGYSANIQGVRNVVDVIKSTQSVQRTIFASSQLVCKVGYQPSSDEDYCPNTLYGHSKVIGEQIVRASGAIGPSWAIVRPTSIWGPWFDIPYRTFFLAINKGIYIHSGQVQTLKKWGFVLNSVEQVHKLLVGPDHLVNTNTFYLADFSPLVLKDYANCAQKEMGARRILTLPLWLMRLIAICGDFLKLLFWKNPPLTSFRLNNIITNEIQETSSLELITGPLPYTYQSGITKTVSWLKSQNLI
ncbi:MAG: NAD(P)-dependent oxidoreductase [Chloroflexi bacterium HGW-Chloroflexi-4]|jgi:nucleoside-diphosphate-sugar epimerase|nr:MAG: NAD(P)-dependent oxidoreductase [Chloroflexi bacterium HGW-Chloroflexi-4]